MNPSRAIRRPALSDHARYRWDEVRRQHQLVFPEGLLVLNDTGAAIVKHCDGRSTSELIAALEQEFDGGSSESDVVEFLHRLAEKGHLHDAADR